MKYTLLVCSLLIFAACAEKPLDENRAKSVAEEVIAAADAGDYAKVESLYAPSFLESEPMEIKKEKLERLRTTLGKVQSVEFLKSTSVAEFGQPLKLVLEYKVTHAGAVTIEKFSIVEEEGGYKIASYGVESAN